MVQIDVLLEGQRFKSRQGVVGYCSVLLFEGRERTLFDVGHVGRRVVLLEALEERGLSPADIDTVVLSHAHWDHAQNLDLFDQSRILMHPDERRYANAPHRNDWATPAWTGAMLSHEDPRIVEVDEGYELEPGIRVLHTPGHSVGSIALSIDTAAGVSVVAGDVLHYATAALTRRNPIVFWNDEQATASITRLVEVGDVIYPGHDRPFRVTSSGEIEYLRPYELTILNVEQDDPGFAIERTPPADWIMPGIEEQRLLPRATG